MLTVSSYGASLGCNRHSVRHVVRTEDGQEVGDMAGKKEMVDKFRDPSSGSISTTGQRQANK